MMIATLALSLSTVSPQLEATQLEAPDVTALGREQLAHVDARMRAWSELWHAGELDRLLASLEDDLRGDAPHVYASWLWSSAVERSGVPRPDAPSRARELTQARAQREAGRDQTLLEAWPVERIAAVDDLGLLNQLDFAASAADDLERHLAVVERMLHVAPDDWWPVWSGIGLIGGDDRARLRLLEACAPTTELGGTPGARVLFRYASWAPDHDDWDRAQRVGMIALLRDWLAEHPGDWGAHACLGTYLQKANYHEEALHSFARAAWSGPQRVYAGRAAQELVDLGRAVDARAVLSAWTGARGAALELELAEACADSGAPGYARPILADLIEADPAHGGAHALMARLEARAGRHERALEHARHAVAADPADVDRRRSLFAALIERGDRRAAFELAEATLGELTTGTIDDVRGLASDYADELERDGLPEDSAAVHRRLVDQWPGTAWTWRMLAADLAALDRLDEARAALRAALERQPWSRWGVARAVEWAELAGGRAAADEELSALRERWPTVRRGWLAAAARLDGAEATALLEEAAARLPGRAWPVEELADRARSTDPVAALALMDRLEAPARPMDEVIWQFRRAHFIRTALVQGGAPVEARLGQFFAALARCEQMGFDRDELHHERGWVLNWQGERGAAAREWLEAARADPNDTGWGTNLKHLGFPEELGGGVVNARLFDLFERDPFDGQRVNDVVHYLAKWGGSPVEVVRLCDHLREELPEAFRTGRAPRDLGHVLGRLGDSRGGFERRYARARYVGTSERYIRWYEAARDRALEADWTRVEVDAEEGVLRTTRADGTMEERGHHPVSGKITLARRGAAWIRAEYTDEFGQLLASLEASSGRRVELGYDDEARIVRIVDSEHGELTFEYPGGATEPSTIRVAGLGELRFPRDEAGELSEPVAIGTDGEEAGVELALRVAAANQELMSLAVRMAAGDLEGLLPPDSEQSRLEQAAAEAEGYREQVTTRIALARWLVANAARRPGAADEAEYHLDELWWPLTNDTEAWDRARLAEVVGLMRELDAARSPHGVTAWVASAWAERRAQLEALIAEHGDASLREVVAALDAEPLVVLEAQRWLPASDLENEAFWRAWGPADLVPSRRAPELEVRATLARANGDLLVGSSLGLHVRRDGWWRWYVWDERGGALVEGDLDAPATASSSVHALAESADGERLWIGTANGLLELAAEDDSASTSGADPYARAARRRVTPADGLPTPAVDALAAWRDGVVVGTARGAVHVPRDGSPGGVRALTEAPTTRLTTERSRRWTLRVDRDALTRARYLAPGAAADALFDQLDALLLEGEDPTPLLARLDPYPAEGDALSMFFERFVVEGEDVEELLLVLTDRAWLAFSTDAEPRVLCDHPLADFAVDLDYGLAYALDRQRVVVADWSEAGPLQLRALPDQANIVSGGRIQGLALAPVDTDGYWGRELVVLTDAGLSIWAAGHFEHLRVPGGDRAVGARHLAWTWDEDAAPSWFVVTTAGVRAFERGEVQVTRGHVRALLSAPRWGLTFVAFDDGRGLWAVDQADGVAVPFASVDARCLALDVEGNLVTHDGDEVLLFERGSTTWRTLFDARPTPVPGFEDSWAFGVKDIVADPDGTLWVLSGGSVFRWRDGEVEEFSFAVDRERFPSETWTVASLLRGPGGRLFAVGSDESHLTSRGQQMRGGLLAFDEATDRFVRVHDERWGSSALFWLSHTDLGDGRSVVGTPDNFFVIDDGSLTEPLEDSESYRALHDADPRLWLGTEGVPLGDDAWLFGCARGLVVLRDDTWLAAERLDRTLPDQELGFYGARHVTALARDAHGRLYVGTSRGLLVHSGGLDATRLLMDAGRPDVAAADVERRKLRAQAEVLLAGIEGADDPAAVRLRALIKSRERIAALSRATDAGGLRIAESLAGAQDEEAGGADVERALRREQATYNRRLREIEFSDPVLAQLLELEPLDLAAAAARLPEGVAVLQLMPSLRRLYLNLVTADRTLVREVEVARDDLFRECEAAARLLRDSVQDLSRGSFVALGAPTQPAAGAERAAAERLAELQDLLARLYDRVLRPIEAELDGIDVLLVSPTGALAQVPPAAWLRRGEGGSQYAIERVVIGVLTDLHKLELGVTAGLLGSAESLVVGDPDATLPGARDEARAVHDLLGSERELLIGEQATLESITAASEGASVLHLATHGRIDVKRPVDSHLVLAGGERMMVYDICTLPLELADLAVLSACESAVGPTATAYGSLANAFLNAGVPITIATLWQVSDRWSGELVEEFYGHYAAGSPPHLALARAQRALIAKHGAALSPAAWAGYVVFGVPGR